MSDAERTEGFLLRTAATTLTAVAALWLFVLSLDAWQVSVAAGTVGCALALIGLRREAHPGRRLQLAGCALIGGVVAVGLLVANWALIAKWSFPS